MLRYDAARNVLYAQKVTNIDMSKEMDVLMDLKESYNLYRTKTIYEDIKFLEDKINGKTSFPVKLVPHVGSLQGNKTNLKSDLCYPVTVDIDAGGRSYPNVPVFKIPYMDDFCKLNFQGKWSVLVNQLVSSDDLTYTEKKKTINLTLRSVSIKIIIGKTGTVDVNTGNSKMALFTLIEYMAMEAGLRDFDIRDHIFNPVLRIVKSDDKSVQLTQLAARQDSMRTNDFVANLSEDPRYLVGDTRDSINEVTSLDGAFYETLSREVAGYPAGTVLNQSVVDDLKSKEVTKLYLEYLPVDETKTIDSDDEMVLLIDEIPAGTPMCRFLATMLPDIATELVVPTTIKLDPPINLEGQTATRDVLEFMRSYGCTYVMINGVRKCFEVEVITNGSVLARFIKDAPSDIDGFTWIHRGPSGNWETYDPDIDTLTYLDMLSLYSVIGRMILTGKNPFLDRDTSFLKKVNLANEAFSSNFRYAATKICTQYSANIQNFLSGNGAHSATVFSGMTSMFVKYLRRYKLLAESDTTNVIAEVSRIIHVTTITPTKEVDPAQRQIAVPYFGRICPYETPEGGNLGLVNSKALGCRIKNGNMYTYVRKVHSHGDTITIDTTPTLISVKDEMKYRMGDILSLVPISDNTFKNTRVTAKVPNPELDGDRTIFATIYSNRLDYVYAHTEQFLSPVAAMIPFASSNDAVRISFGSKMIKAAIYIMNTEAPRVRTQMYTDVFNYSNTFLIRASNSGTVREINHNYIVLDYDDGTTEEIAVKETRITKTSVLFLHYNYTVGDKFDKHAILVESSISKNGIFSPARNVVVGYMHTGYNYEDATHITDYTAVNYVSLSSNTRSKVFNEDTSKAMYKVGHTNLFKYIEEGDPIDTVDIKVIGESSAPIPKTVYAEHESGIYYECESRRENGAHVFDFNLLGFNKLKRGDKMAGFHGNKGVVARVSANSEVPILRNGRPLDVMLNPCGVPSRMNVGQLYEAPAGLSALVLDTGFDSDSFNGASPSEVKLALNLAYDLANTPNIENDRALFDTTFAPYAEKIGGDSFAEHCWSVIHEIRDWRDCFDRKGDAELWNPATGKFFPNRITIGCVYFLKLQQEVDTKMHARAGLLEEDYTRMSRQPTKGGKRGGGQSMGEMELCAIAAYGAANLLHEICNENSDNEGARINRELEALQLSKRVPKEFCVPRSSEELIYWLEVMGVLLESDGGELPEVDKDISMRKSMLHVRRMLSTNKGDDDDASTNLEDEGWKAMRSVFNKPSD